MEPYISDELLENTFLFCYKRITDQERARDMAQDILLYALAAIKQGKKIENFYAWYWQMANYKIIDYYRRGKNNVRSLEDVMDVLVEPGGSDGILEGLVSAEEVEKLSYALAHLAAVHRDIIIRFYLQEQSINQIATELKIPVGTVKGRLFDARKDLHTRIERMDKEKVGNKRVAILPVDFSFYWMSDDVQKVLNSSLRAQILKSTRMEKKTLNQISEEIGASPVYIEEEIKTLLENELMLEPVKGKYLSDVCMFPKAACERALAAQKKLVADMNVGQRYFDVMMAMKEKLMSYDFYGNNFSYDYLLWYFTARSSKSFAGMCINYVLKNYAQNLSDRKYRYFFVSGTYYESKKQYRESKDNLMSVGYQYVEYHNAKCGNFAVHDTLSEIKELGFFYENDREKSRINWIDDVNGQLIFALLENPSLKLNVHEQEMAAELISKGVLSKTEKGLELNIPVFTEDNISDICNCWYECLKNLSEEFAENLYTKVNEQLLPYVRDDLRCAYYNFIVLKYFGITEQLIDFGMRNKYLKVPSDLKNVYGLVIVQGQKTEKNENDWGGI